MPWGCGGQPRLVVYVFVCTFALLMTSHFIRVDCEIGEL